MVPFTGVWTPNVLAEGIQWSRSIAQETGRTPASLRAPGGGQSPRPAWLPFSSRNSPVPGKLRASCSFTAFISSPSFKMPNAATRPGDVIPSPSPNVSTETHFRPPTDGLLPASLHRARRQRQRRPPRPRKPSALFGIKITRCRFHILKETWKITDSQKELRDDIPTR